MPELNGVILAFLHSLIKYSQSARSLLGGGRQQGVAVTGGVFSGQDSNLGSTVQLKHYFYPMVWIGCLTRKRATEPTYTSSLVCPWFLVQHLDKPGREPHPLHWPDLESRNDSLTFSAHLLLVGLKITQPLTGREDRGEFGLQDTELSARDRWAMCGHCLTSATQQFYKEISLPPFKR